MEIQNLTKPTFKNYFPKKLPTSDYLMQTNVAKENLFLTSVHQKNMFLNGNKTSKNTQYKSVLKLSANLFLDNLKFLHTGHFPKKALSMQKFNQNRQKHCVISQFRLNELVETDIKKESKICEKINSILLNQDESKNNLNLNQARIALFPQIKSSSKNNVQKVRFLRENIPPLKVCLHKKKINNVNFSDFFILYNLVKIVRFSYSFHAKTVVKLPKGGSKIEYFSIRIAKGSGFEDTGKIQRKNTRTGIKNNPSFNKKAKPNTPKGLMKNFHIPTCSEKELEEKNIETVIESSTEENDVPNMSVGNKNTGKVYSTSKWMKMVENLLRSRNVNDVVLKDGSSGLLFGD